MNNNTHKKIEDILNSLDGHPKASMPAFFYTRLKARMTAAEETGKTSNQRSWMLRPVFALTGLVTILIVNAFVLFQRSNITDNSSSEPDSVQAIAAEYSLNNENSTALLDINQDNK